MTCRTLLYPRLPRSVAKSLILDRVGATVLELTGLSALSHPDAEPSATGGHPVDSAKLREVQQAIREVAERAGFPDPLGGPPNLRPPCGTTLLRSDGHRPRRCGRGGRLVIPHAGPRARDRTVALPSTPEDRLVGHPRNVLRRTWWRAWALGPDLSHAPDGCEPLGEDESVQIMERPSLGGNRRTARALQAALWRAEGKASPCRDRS